VIINNSGIAKTADFTTAGMKNYEVAALCKEGFIERIHQGFYQLPNSNQITEEQLIQELLPQGTVCVESALFHYGYSDFAPHEWSIAVPRTASRAIKKIEEFPIKAYYIQKDFLQIGKAIDNFNGVELTVYDRERTICDCFKYRTKLDSDDAMQKKWKAFVRKIDTKTDDYGTVLGTIKTFLMGFCGSIAADIILRSRNMNSSLPIYTVKCMCI